MALSNTKKAITRKKGFSLFEVVLLVAILLGAVFLLLPAFAKAKISNHKYSCYNNLRTAGLMLHCLAEDYGGLYPMSVSTSFGGSMELEDSGQVFPHFQVMSNVIGGPRFLLCSSDKKRTFATNWTDINDFNISYFLNLDADETNPRMVLAGDRHITGGLALGSKIVLVTSNSPLAWGKALHKSYGTLCLVDGSVTVYSNQALRVFSITNAISTSRLAIP